MAIPASVGDKFQVRVVGEMEGQETNNVFHFMAATGIDDVELRLILALAQCFIDELLPTTSSIWSLKRIVWKQVNPVLGVEHVTIPTGTLVGGANPTALPSFCSAVISIRTLVGGKSHRGRMYLPGIAESMTVASDIDTTNPFWASLISFAACLASKFILGDPPAANSFQMMVYSRKLGGSTFPYGNAGFTAVSSFIPVQKIGTTRSRKVGRGA